MRARRRGPLSFGILAGDQALYAASNFAIAIIAGRWLDLDGFATFALQLLLVTLLVNLLRSVRNEPDLAGGAVRPPGAQLLAFTGVAIALGSLFTSNFIVVTAVAAYVVVVQDRARYAALARGAGGRLVAGDALWLIAVALIGLVGTGAHPNTLILLWSSGAAVSCVVLVQRPSPPPDHRSRPPSRMTFLTDHALHTAMTHGASLAAAAVLSAGQFAQLRASIILYGPIGVSSLALSTWLFHRATDQSMTLQRVELRARYISAFAMLAAGVLAVVPRNVGQHFLGASWPPPALLVAIGATVAAQALWAPRLNGLKLAGQLRELLIIRTASAGAIIVGVIFIGALTDSALAVSFMYVTVNASLAAVVSTRSFVRRCSRRGIGAGAIEARRTVPS